MKAILDVEQAAKRASVLGLRGFRGGPPRPPEGGWPKGHLHALPPHERRERLVIMRLERQVMAKTWTPRSKQGKRKAAREVRELLADGAQA